MKAVNPATEEVIGEYPAHTWEEVEQRLLSAERAFQEWRATPFSHRARLMHKAAEMLRRRKDEWAGLMTQEMGKPVTASDAEVEKCAACCEFFADNAEKMLAAELIPSDASKSYVRCDPLGPVLAVMPWNFPYWQVFRFAAPGLMTGNVAVLKHASNVPGCALAIETIFRDAGFPQGAFTTLMIGTDAIERVIAHPIIRAVTLTGSEKAGMSVAAAAGAALKKTVLELGGSDPFIVLADVDVDATAKRAVEARCINSGQSCIAAKRFIVEEEVADEFEAAMTKHMAGMRIGDPADRSTEIGPLARADLRDELHRQVRDSIGQGASLLTGGEAVAGRGYFYKPAVLGNVKPGMAAFDEETFGPVAAIIRAKDPDEAISLANRSRYGLGASIWTKNVALAEKLATGVDAGAVFINGIVKSDPRLPFGGVKYSGYGRELSQVGIREFVNLKTVWIG